MTQTKTKAKADKAEMERTILAFNREVRLIGKRAIDRHDKDPIKMAETRTEAYYNLCDKYAQKPTWEGLALAFGMDRHVMTKWREHQVGWVDECGLADFLAKEWAFLCSVHVSAMEAGLMDKITGIFIARNNFNYVNEDPKQVNHEVNVNFTADQLIEAAKNLQLTDKPVDVEFEVVEDKKDEDDSDGLILEDPDELILE